MAPLISSPILSCRRFRPVQQSASPDVPDDAVLPWLSTTTIPRGLLFLSAA